MKAGVIAEFVKVPFSTPGSLPRASGAGGIAPACQKVRVGALATFPGAAVGPVERREK